MATDLYLTEALNAIKAVNMTSSTVKKTAILTANKNNRALRNIIKYLSNTVISNIRREKLNKILFYRCSPMNINSLDELLAYYQRHPNGSESDVIVTQCFLKKISSERRELYVKIICKEIPLGCGKSTIIKVFGEDFLNGDIEK